MADIHMHDERWPKKSSVQSSRGRDMRGEEAPQRKGPWSRPVRSERKEGGRMHIDWVRGG